MAHVVSFDPLGERLITEARIVRRAYYLARRCGWRLKMCRRGLWRGGYQLLTIDGCPLTMPLRPEAIVMRCEKVLHVL
jgi:hypothetical protein